MGEHPTPEQIMQIGLGFWASKTLLSAVEMGLFTELAKRPEGLEAVQGGWDCIRDRRAIFWTRWWRWDFWSGGTENIRNTPETDLFLDKKKPSYIGGILEMANQRLYGHWAHLTEGLRTGLPQNEVRGGGAPLFETLYADPARLKEFLEGDDRDQPRFGDWRLRRSFR